MLVRQLDQGGKRLIYFLNINKYLKLTLIFLNNFSICGLIIWFPDKIQSTINNKSERSLLHPFNYLHLNTSTQFKHTYI